VAEDETGETQGQDQRVYRQHRFAVPKGATDLLVVRHGESAPARLGKPAPTVDGHSDPALAPEGREQSQRLAERLRHESIDAIYVTTLRRTAQTAEPLATALGLTPHVQPDLREVYLGEWEGIAFRKYVSEQHPIAIQMFLEQRWDVIPGAESNEQFSSRVRRGLETIIAAHPGQRVVVVVHGGVIGQIMSLASGAPTFGFIGADNASISQVVAMPQPWMVRRFNDTAHLDPVFTIAAEPLT
jgi:probable phosphoglycerate mutase